MKRKNLKEPENSTVATSPPPQPRSFVAPMMDSTSHLEISFMQNKKFSEEIIREAEKVFDLGKLRRLKENSAKFLGEAKFQINKLWQSKEALATHTDLFIVTFQINLGYLLDEVESAFSQKFKYTNWLRMNFGDDRFRYFEQARQLAGMGDTAVKYRSLGKHRLLKVNHLQKTLNKSFEEILKNHPFLDTTQDLDGDLFKSHADAIITYYRFKDAEVENIKFEQANLMAQYEHKAVEVGTIRKFKKEWDKAEDKDNLLQKFVLDKMALATGKESRSVSEESLNRVLANLNDYFERIDISDPQWIRKQKELLDNQIFYQAYGHLSWLKKKLREVSRNRKKGSKKKKR